MGQSLVEEQAKLSQLQQAYQKAKDDDDYAKERDFNRRDGSPRQDQMHEDSMARYANAL